MCLRFKIFIGYLVLIVFLVFTIYSFRKEQMIRSRLQDGEKELLHVRRLAEQTYASLLELSTQSETVSVWDEEDFLAYRNKRREVCLHLKEMQGYIQSSRGQARIDSLCTLLVQKENLLDTVMQTFDRLQEVSEFINRKIPLIVSNVHDGTEDQDAACPTDSMETDSKVKKTFWVRLFGKRDRKSAYFEQWEQRQKSAVLNQQRAKAAGMLHSLKKEVFAHQERKKEELLSQMENLYLNNLKLNRRLHCIIKNFEKEETSRLENRYKQFVAERDESFHLLSLLAISIFLLSVILYLIVHRDLKHKYRYQCELETSNREKQELLQSRQNMMQSIAHDLRSPLATISGSLELYEKTEETDRTGHIDNIRYASGYMLSLVDTLMEYYQLDTGLLHVHPSIFHLETLFCEIADSHIPAARKKDIRLFTSFTGMDSVAVGDKRYLQQIVNNLLSNAVKFTEKGTVRLRAEFGNERLSFEVEDTGIGIHEEDLGRIFTAFEQLENSPTESGFGLGLAIVSRLVSEMKGDIQVESKPGKGSRFTVRIPLSAGFESFRIQDKRISDSLSLNNLHVLLMDDDPRQLGIAREMFRQCHAACDCCMDSRGLIALLRENDYDVLLTDIQMPEMNGYAVLELLRSSNIPQGANIPVIALTARMDDEKEYLRRGFSACIRKPFSKESLAHGITAVVGTARGSEWKPDFSLILAGEENRQEMLAVFVMESRKDLRELHVAMQENNRSVIWEILHKNLPLWETVRLDYPMDSLRQIVVCNPEEWKDDDLMQIDEIERAAERLVEYAERSMLEL